MKDFRYLRNSGSLCIYNMRFFNFFIIFWLVCFSIEAQQNLNENYKPLKSTGVLPEIFTQNIRQIIQKDISDLNKGKESDKSIKSDYFTAANYEIERIVKSGNTLVNDEVSVYLNKVADVVLAKDPDLRKKLSIYPLKSFVVNAYCYDKGYLFINLGLIAQAESEAQLAYTLCHEISHYTKRHNINGYVKNQKINREHYNGKSEEDKLIEKCQYSKEHESEADIEGFKLLEQSGYDYAEAEKDFDVLQYSHLPFELVEFKKDFFESQYYKIPERYFLKEVSSIRNISNEDDTKHTHPNTFKRKQAIHELINGRYNNGKAKNIVGEKEFEYIRDLARMELCRLYLVYRDFPSALYSSYILQKKYPNNEYLTEISAKALYGMTLKSLGQLHYNSDSYLENGFPGYETVESYPQQLYHLISKMPTNEFTILSLNYIYRAHKKFPNNKPLSAYSDTLLKYIAKINWGIVDFVRMEKKPESLVKTDSVKVEEGAKSKTDLIAKIQKENNYKNYDTAYYKDAFLDLFISDKEFSSKFPTSGAATESYGFSDYQRGRNSAVKRKKSKKREYITANNKIEKVILLEPFYLKTNEGKGEVLYLTSDEKQEKLVQTINSCAKRQNFSLVTLDPGLLTSNEVDKMNDYSVITDWFNEKFDAVDEDGNEIMNTNEIDNIISKYGTQYVLKTGIISYKIGLRKRTYYYSFIFDLKGNEIVYKKYEVFRDTDSQSLINAKVYQTFYELTHSK